MSRLTYPPDFLNRTILFKNIKAKHDADGQNSVLTPFLTQQGIDLAADDVITDAAIANDTLFQQTAKTAEDNTQDRNNLFVPAFEHLQEAIQYLKGFYKGNVKELGNWGITVDEDRINYPPDFLHRVELFNLVFDHNANLGANSPLPAFFTANNIDFVLDKADVDAAVVKNTTMQQEKRDAEKYRSERDLGFDPVFEHVRGIGQFLKGLYKNDPQILGDWGFTIDQSTQGPYRRARIVPAAGQISIEGVQVADEFRNTGSTNLLVFKGTEAVGESIEVLAGQNTLLPVDHTTITVQNQSVDTDGECSLVY